MIICVETVKVQTLRAQVAEKDMFISELLDRIAIVECEVRLCVRVRVCALLVMRGWLA